jgi:hypothetical protein
VRCAAAKRQSSLAVGLGLLDFGAVDSLRAAFQRLTGLRGDWTLRKEEVRVCLSSFVSPFEK